MRDGVATKQDDAGHGAQGTLSGWESGTGGADREVSHAKRVN